MRIAYIKNGIVENVVMGDQSLEDGVNYIASDIAKIGDTYSAGVFTSPVVADTRTPNEIVMSQIVELEASITVRRLREATLTAAGKTWLTNVDAQIATLRATLV